MSKFSRLKWAIRSGLDIDSNDMLSNFVDYQSKLATQSKTDIDFGAMIPISVCAFEVNNLYQVLVSNRSNNIINTLVDKSLLNWITLSNNSINNKFRCAKAIIKINGQEKIKTSKITGRRYMTKITDSYTYPFGKEFNSTKTIGSSMALIELSVKAKNNNNSVYFKVEKWY